MNRVDRLMAMVVHLQGRRLVRAEDMAAHFEVSVRTVYRDIVALGEAGIPIRARQASATAWLRGTICRRSCSPRRKPVPCLRAENSSIT